MKGVNFQNRIWFFDVDDTLVNTAPQSEEAANGIADVFTPKTGADIAGRIRARFIDIFFSMMGAHNENLPAAWRPPANLQEANDQILERIKTAQKPVIKNFGGMKKWSREVLIKLAAEDCGVGHPEPDLIEQAAERYWNLLTHGLKAHAHAWELVAALRDRGRPIFLVTSSDARLHMRPDGLFVYDPPHSEWFKRKRLEHLRTLGVDFQGAVIGDPVDKPSIEFFQKALDLAESTLGDKVFPEDCVIVGDSYITDLQTPLEKLDFGCGVLIRSDKSTSFPSENRVVVTDNLVELIPQLS